MTALMLMGWVLGAAPQGEFSLEALMARMGEDEKARLAQTCAFEERTVVHELDSDGKVKGSVIREYDVSLDAEGHRRVLKNESFEGDPSRLVKQRPKDSEEKPHPGPFHPDERPHFQFELVSLDKGRAVIRYTPKEPHEKRMQGTVVVDVPKAMPLRMEMEPSKNPRFVKALKLDITLAQTACGPRMVKVTTRGSGGMLFFKARFHAETTLTGFTPKAK